MPQFMCRIKAAVLGSFVRIQKYERNITSPIRVSVYLPRIHGQRIDAHPIGFEKMNHVPNRKHSEVPLSTYNFRCCLRIGFASEVRNLSRWQLEFLAQPTVQEQTKGGLACSHVSLGSSHCLHRAEAATINARLVEIVTHEERARKSRDAHDVSNGVFCWFGFP